MQDFISFVTPEMAGSEAQAVSSAVVLPGGVFSPERLRGMPDELVYAMAAALQEAAAEMEVCARVHAQISFGVVAVLVSVVHMGD